MTSRTGSAQDVGDVLGGRYRLRRWLGAGGMGTVWEAEDQRLHRPVAVKVVAEVHRGDESVVRRFEREARTAAQLVHPNLATVFDYGRHDDELFLVMELLDGDTWSQRLRSGPMQAGEATGVGAEVADGLTALHDTGIVHRDVKPANVVLTDRGAKLLDFGIASGLGEPLTAAGNVMGTAAYLSPERVQGDVAGPAADVYALGAVLFEAISGRRVFAGATPTEVAMAHVHGAPDDLAELEPTVPEAVAVMVGRCLAKAPEDRPSASELSAVLRAADGDGREVTTAFARREGAADVTEIDSPLPIVDTELVRPLGLSPDATPPAGTAVLAAPRGSVAHRPEDRRRRTLVVAALVAALVLLAATTFALSRAGEDGDAEATPSTTPASTTAPTAAPTTTSTVATTTTVAAVPSPPVTEPPADPVAAAAAVVTASVDEGVAAGELEGRAADGILGEVEKAVQAADRGDAERALGHVDDAESRLQQALEEGDVTDDRASAISQTLSDLRSAIEQSVSDGAGGDQTDPGPGNGNDRDDDD